VLPTGRLFGRITQKGSLKSGAAGEICGQVSANFEHIGPKRGRTSEKFVSFLFYSFPIHTDKNINIFSKKGKITGWPNILFSADEFLHRTGRKVLSRVGNNDPDPEP
jgi:hypothetical protein